MPYKSAALACLFLAAIGGAFYMWQAQMPTAPTAAAALEKVYEDFWDTKFPEGAKTEEACSEVDSMDSDGENHKRYLSCRKQLVQHYDIPDMTLLGSATCAAETPLPECVVEQGLKILESPALQDKWMQIDVPKFIQIAALAANPAQLERLQKFVPADSPNAQIYMALARHQIDEAVQIIQDLQATGASFVNEFIPQRLAANALINKGDWDAARKLILKTQSIRFKHPDMIFHGGVPPSAHDLIQILLATPAPEQALDFVRSFVPDNVFLIPQKNLPTVCENSLETYSILSKRPAFRDLHKECCYARYDLLTRPSTENAETDKRAAQEAESLKQTQAQELTHKHCLSQYPALLDHALKNKESTGSFFSGLAETITTRGQNIVNTPAAELLSRKQRPYDTADLCLRHGFYSCADKILTALREDFLHRHQKATEPPPETGTYPSTSRSFFYESERILPLARQLYTQTNNPDGYVAFKKGLVLSPLILNEPSYSEQNYQRQLEAYARLYRYLQEDQIVKDIENAAAAATQKVRNELQAISDLASQGRESEINAALSSPTRTAAGARTYLLTTTTEITEPQYRPAFNALYTQAVEDCVTEKARRGYDYTKIPENLLFTCIVQTYAQTWTMAAPKRLQMNAYQATIKDMLYAQ
jgi:hypothetical protein